MVGFLTSSSTTRLYRGRAPRQERLTILRAATHETELGDHDFCLSRSHYTDTGPTCRERAATAGIEPGTSSPGVARSTAELPRPQTQDKEGRELNQVDQFKYLGVTFSEEGGPETAVRARVKAWWQTWRELIADKKIPTKLKTKLHTTGVRPVILYGAECWTTGVKKENILEKTEMRMLRRIKGVTVKDKMNSEDIRKELGVGSIKSKARESRLRWFGHVHRREQESNLRQVMDMEIPGRRPRGRPRGRWRDLVDRDMRELREVPEDADDRNFWRRRIRTADPSPG